MRCQGGSHLRLSASGLMTSEPWICERTQLLSQPGPSATASPRSGPPEARHLGADPAQVDPERAVDGVVGDDELGGARARGERLEADGDRAAGALGKRG